MQTALPMDEAGSTLAPTMSPILQQEKVFKTIAPPTEHILPTEEVKQIFAVTSDPIKPAAPEQVPIMTVIPRRIEPKPLPVDTQTTLPVDAPTTSVQTN